MLNIASAKSRSVRGASHQPAFMGSCLTISHMCLPHLPSRWVSPCILSPFDWANGVSVDVFLEWWLWFSGLMISISHFTSNSLGWFPGREKEYETSHFFTTLTHGKFISLTRIFFIWNSSFYCQHILWAWKGNRVIHISMRYNLIESKHHINIPVKMVKV